MPGISQQVVWTLLPNGTAKPGAGLKASLLVTPRLMVDGGQHSTLEAFHDWQDWPSVIQGATFTVLVDGVPQQTTTAKSALDSKIWKALFPKSTFVRPFEPDAPVAKYGTWLSHPTAALAKNIEAVYAQHAAAAIKGIPTKLEHAVQALNAGLLGFSEAHRQNILQRASSVTTHPAGYLNVDQALAAAMKTPRVRHGQKPMNLAVGKTSAAPAEGFSGALNRLWDYHGRPSAFVAHAPETADEFIQRIDFHQIASNLTQYQNLVRVLGLVIDLEFIPSAISGGNHVVQVLVAWPKTSPTKPDFCPPVSVTLNGSTFEALPRAPGGLLKGRWLNLGHADYSVVKMQVDTAALRYDACLAGIENEIGAHAEKAAFIETTYDDTDFVAKPSMSSLPALQSGGVQLVHDKHADVVQSRFARAAELEAACAKPLPSLGTPLSAEDIVRGYRIDVFDTIPNKWFSLNLRDGKYTFLNDATIPPYATVGEEGMVGVGASTQTDDKGTTVTRLSPVLLAWRGWSLVAKRPDDADSKPVPGAPLATQFTPTQGSLPMLRFGRTYRIRVRVVDLAGNSAKFQTTNTTPDYGSDTHLYCRYEPVGSPDLALFKSSGGAVDFPTDGESMGVMAIHSFNAAPSGNAVPSNEQARRVVLPPRVDFDFAEIEGAFDTGNSLDPAKVQQAAAFLQKYPRPKKNVLSQVEERPRQPSGKGKVLPSSAKPAIYSCYQERSEIPYLVDPWAVAAVIKVDTVPDSTLAALRAAKTMLTQNSVATFTSKLSLISVAPTLGSPGSKYQPTKWGSSLSAETNFDILTGAPLAYQPAAAAAPNASALRAINAVHGKHVANHVDEPFSPSDIATAQLALTNEYAKGPPDELARLHVVPYYGNSDTGSSDYIHVPADWPHAKPFTIVAVDNGQTQPVFDVSTREFRVPLKKGERVFLKMSSLIPQEALKKMQAWWQFSQVREPPPDYALLTAKGRNWLATPWRTIEVVHAVQKPLVTPDLGVAVDRKLFDKPATLFFGVNLDGPTTVRVDLFANWQEPVDDTAKAAPAVNNHQEQVLQKMVPRVQKASDYFYIGGQQHFPDTRYRRVSYRMDAISRFREFMPASVRADDANMNVTSNVYRLWVPNAAPPPAPKVLYVVPTFGWNRSGTQSARLGYGLRVYLDRPWFVTGYGEMLAVVLPPQNVSARDVDKAYVTKVTQWGNDPIWLSGRIMSAAPTRADFPAAITKPPVIYPNVSGVLPDETTDWPTASFKLADLPLAPPPAIGTAPNAEQTLRVDVAPHLVGYDAERKLWYADVLINPQKNAYYPFVRLALARYHPLSLPGAHLSSVVLTEFQQLVPDRLAVVTRSGTSATIAVYGTLPQNGRDSPKAGVFLAEVQTLAAGADPDLDWVTTSQTTGGLRINPDATAANVHLATLPLVDQQHAMVGGKTAVAQLGSIDPRRLGAIQPGDIWRGQQHLLWQATVTLPGAPAGGNRRLLITESENYRTTEVSPDLDGQRIVYLETMDV